MRNPSEESGSSFSMDFIRKRIAAKYRGEPEIDAMDFMELIGDKIKLLNPKKFLKLKLNRQELKNYYVFLGIKSLAKN